MSNLQKKILMIAAEYPPCLSAGVQRTFHFSKNLISHGWQPLVLSAHNRIYRNLDNQLEVSSQISQYLRRAFAADASRHFAINGKYFDFLEDPDKYASWYYPGYWLGMSMIHEHKPDVIWSTFPVSTAHRIALKLKKKTGLKWIADFRDPLHCHCSGSLDRITKLAKKIDAETVENADVLVFATDNMRTLYSNAFPHVDGERFVVIENGYDEEVHSTRKITGVKKEPFTLLYSGGLYEVGRDPVPLFYAISRLITEGIIETGGFRLVFRGAGDGAEYMDVISELHLTGFVFFKASIPYAQSIDEISEADALLVLQGEIFSNQIPGKVYEYIATGNAILGLLGSQGASNELLKSIPNAYVAGEDNIEEIEKALIATLDSPVRGSDFDPTPFSRKSRCMELVEILNKLPD